MSDQKSIPFLNGQVSGVGTSKPDGRNHKEGEHNVKPEISNAPTDIECDVLVVGAGFSGITAIHRFRQLGLKVKCFESGGGLGGVWYWNRYPGARVDSESPFYQLNIPEVYNDWTFAERFPGHEELRKYMAFIDQKLNLSKDVYFNARVVDGSRDEKTGVWIVQTDRGHKARAKYLMLASGLLHRFYTPDFPGLEEYKGELHRSAAWDESYSAKGKKVALIGAGATAVQITQELGKEADQLTVFLRRPSYCIPMQQRPLSVREQKDLKVYLPALFKLGRASATGFPLARMDRNALEVPEEERTEIFERLWSAGGFSFALGNFANVAIDKDANRIPYDFWKKKVRQRLTDPEKSKIMAPDDPPYYWGTKRSPLEQDYYEVLNQSNVSLHDLNATPLKSFAERGIVTADGKLHEFDTVVLATGFDSYTGSMTRMGLKNKDGVELKHLWEDGVSTYLGLMVAGFPNMFMAYSPQSPTPLSNGTTIIEAQIETIADIIKKLESEGVTSIEAQKSAEVEWKASLKAMVDQTLFPFTDSWWNGGNIPGKKAENLLYIAGIDNYEAQVRGTMDGWKGFDVVKAG